MLDAVPQLFSLQSFTATELNKIWGGQWCQVFLHHQHSDN